jgi:hypothetical protein
MSPATLKRIGIALAILLFLWGAVEIFTGRSDEIEHVAAIAAITQDAADTVEFVRQADTIRLVKGNGAWRVNGYPASPDAIDDLFAALGDDVEGALIARSPTSHARMGVDSAAAALRIVTGAETVTRLLVGDQGMGYETRYVRPAGDERVYLIQGDIARMLVRDVPDWRDKRVVTVDTPDIAGMAVEGGGRPYTLRRADSLWTFQDGSPTDSSAIRRLLQAWGSVSAQGGTPFASPAQIDSADFRRPDRRVTLFGADGDTLARLVFDSTASGFWVRHDSGGTVYNLMRWRVNELVPPDSSLRRKAP